MTGRRRGFTIIEGLVVVAIVAIMAAIVLPMFMQKKRAAAWEKMSLNQKFDASESRSQKAKLMLGCTDEFLVSVGFKVEADKIIFMRDKKDVFFAVKYETYKGGNRVKRVWYRSDYGDWLDCQQMEHSLSEGGKGADARSLAEDPMQ